KDAPAEWNFLEIAKSDSHGTAQVPYNNLRFGTINVRDADRMLMGLGLVSPASLQQAKVAVALEPECHVIGRITCDELARAGEPIKWSNAYLLFGGQRIGECYAKPGEFEFYLPRGRYTVDVYGEDLKGKYVDFAVPARRSDFQLPPIPLTASNLLRLRGKPA